MGLTALLIRDRDVVLAESGPLAESDDPAWNPRAVLEEDIEAAIPEDLALG